MIIYQSDKDGFLSDILTGDIENIIQNKFSSSLHKKVSASEVSSWRHSLQFMNNILYDPEIPSNCGVSIECQIPQTSKRIDFVITGKDANNKEHAIIVELKQWTDAQLTDKDGIVKTRFRNTICETSHPSYQAWSYSALLNDFNETVYSDKIQLKPCAFLHNYNPDEVITNPFYKEYLDKAPVFLKPDAEKLRQFIKTYVRYGDDTKILYRIDKGKIKPSKQLADCLSSMMKGNSEFVLIDDQKVVFEEALSLMKSSNSKNKNVLIVEGGPGTGKSLVAINLLVELTKKGKVVHYVSKNAAPRAVYESKLTGTLTKTRISNLFKGSGTYFKSAPNTFDALVVDEAHRLNEKSGLYGTDGENQVKEVIRASKLSVFFLDEDQKVTLKDIGSKEEIKKWAQKEGAQVSELLLESQFRCSGSDGYLAWLDHMLQIRETANTDLKDIKYDFRIFSTPTELFEEISEKNKANNKSRVVAGYCWEWTSKSNQVKFDIEFPEYDFKKKWNLATDGSLWILKPESINEIGCIHTCQGLELDYVGVIVGNDLIVRDGTVLVDPSKRAKSDASIKGYKTLLKKDPDLAKSQIKSIIKNTYRTLLTRGMKGCYVYFVDEETRDFFKRSI